MKNKNIGIFVIIVLVTMLSMPFVCAVNPYPNTPTPANGATGVPVGVVTLHANVNSATNLSMTVHLWTNSSGVYTESSDRLLAGNGTVNWTINISETSWMHKYYWGVYANDSNGLIQNTTFTFTSEVYAGKLARDIGPMIFATAIILLVLGAIGVIFKTFFR